jgi:hypothetical protein
MTHLSLRREDRRADRSWQRVSHSQYPLLLGIACVAGRVEKDPNRRKEHILSGPWAQRCGVETKYCKWWDEWVRNPGNCSIPSPLKVAIGYDSPG